MFELNRYNDQTIYYTVESEQTVALHASPFTSILNLSDIGSFTAIGSSEQQSREDVIRQAFDGVVDLPVGAGR